MRMSTFKRLEMKDEQRELSGSVRPPPWEGSSTRRRTHPTWQEEHRCHVGAQGRGDHPGGEGPRAAAGDLQAGRQGPTAGRGGGVGTCTPPPD